MNQRVWLLVWSALLWLGVTSLGASQQNYQEQLAEASIKAYSAMQKGPAVINLGGFAELNLPEAYGYIPADEVRAILALLGNNTSGVMGAVTGNPDLGQESDWFVVLTYNDSGHIMDDEAKEWDTNTLLSSIREGTEAANKVRKERGFDSLTVLGWVKPPKYDENRNRMTWSIKARSENATGPSVNFNTLALSREGYMSMNLVTQLENIETDKAVSDELLASLDFKPGYKYTDFNVDTDRIAEYGLAALITGVAAKKLGLFAVIAAFVAKFAKVIFAAFAGGGALWFKRRKAKSKTEDQDEVS